MKYSEGKPVLENGKIVTMVMQGRRYILLQYESGETEWVLESLINGHSNKQVEEETRKELK